MIPTNTDLVQSEGKVNFLCGVVEGFYGRPWTIKQRRKLFQRMKKMGMNTYLYAPKDDCKHRMYWRDQYSVEEADHLTGMIETAAEFDVLFVYALSPGLDMNYSNAKEVSYLKKKLEQVASFGCKAFSLLFDDIEVDMCEADKQIFQSFAHAQVAVTNEVYQHLEQPETFLFCPTEYCASRAIPTVEQSEYLNTIGSKLLPGIDIMWTGDKVITKDVTLESIQTIAKVLRRPPVIWDNFHANDYDQKRMFLGPYDGRSPELIPHLNGVLTNPNCEFEANFVALHTLAQWSKSNMEEVKKDALLSSSPVSADIKLETQGDDTTGSVPYTSYQPKEALKYALDDWLEEFFDDCDVPKKVAQAPPPIVPPPILASCISSPTTDTSPSLPLAVATSIGVSNLNELPCLDSLMQPVMGPQANSLIDPASSDSETESLNGSMEPMDCALTPSSSPVLSSCMPEMPPVETMDAEMEERLLTHEDLGLLVDMFYTPFEHGNRGVEMLLDLHWLKCTCHVITEAKCKNATQEQIEEAEEWHRRAEKFENDTNSYHLMVEHICSAPNKALLFDLYPYIWDMKVTLSLCMAYVKWLALGHVPLISVHHMHGSLYTWANKSFREAFSSGEREPWVFRGGLQSEFQRLLPLEGAMDLTYPVVPVVPLAQGHTIRPYNHAVDESAVYDICRKTCDDGVDGTDIFPLHPDIVADKFIGSFLHNSPEYCFVIEDEEGICGYVLAALDAKQHIQKLEEEWIPAMLSKYPKPTKNAGDLTPAEEMMCSLHSHKSFLNENLHSRHPSLIRIDVLPERCKDGAERLALAVAVAALKTNGSHGIYGEIHVGDRNTVERYGRLGFTEQQLTDMPDDLVLVARVI